VLKFDSTKRAKLVDMTQAGLKLGYEYVHTVTDYYDGPRKGIANYQGRPHLYECVNYSELFWLAPVESETFQLAMEDWTIWQRWELAYHTGKTELDTHPALPHESARHVELQGILDKVLVIDPQRAVARIGRFEALGNASLPKGVLRPLQVEWTDPQTKKSNKIIHGKDELTQAFPSALRKDVLSALSVLSENRYSSRWQAFSVHLGSELLSIPYRIYYDPPVLQEMRLGRLESEILDCLLTRHHDGFVRQKHLARIIRSRNAWVPCFVVPLVGEYVVEILRVVQESLTDLETSIYADFVRANPEFLNLTERRVVSYWDCYYRSIKKEAYPGFLILDFLKSITKDATR
jgi:hypothetical protein